MTHGGILQSGPQVICAQQVFRNVTAKVRGDAERGCSPTLNLVRYGLSRLCIYAFSERQKRDQEFNDRIDLIDNKSDGSAFVYPISSVKRADGYTRSPMKMKLDLAAGGSRGYWKYHTPINWSNQAKAVGKIRNERATMFFESGAEIVIIDTTFARKAGCVLDESRTQ